MTMTDTCLTDKHCGIACHFDGRSVVTLFVVLSSVCILVLKVFNLLFFTMILFSDFTIMTH